MPDAEKENQYAFRVAESAFGRNDLRMLEPLDRLARWNEFVGRYTTARGLHARASAKFVTFVSRLPESVSVEVEKGGSRVNGTSIMGLMMLGAAKGDSITIHTKGDGADAALLKLVGLVKDSFGED